MGQKAAEKNHVAPVLGRQRVSRLSFFMKTINKQIIK